MKTSNKNLINVVAYVALVIVALLMFVDRLLPVVGVSITGGWLLVFFNVLRTISNLLTIIILGIAGYRFAANGKKWIKVLYWLSVAVFVVATILMWL